MVTKKIHIKTKEKKKMNTNEFYETKMRFTEAIGMTAPISYAQWLALPDTLKAAGLYVNFYEQISLAWSKAKAEFIDDEDGVSTLMQYLMKNVDIIKKNPKKYTPNYVYTVAYNSMGSLRRLKGEQNRYNYTASHYVQNDKGEDLDLFDALVGDEIESIIHKVADVLFDAYSDLDNDTKLIIQNILYNRKLTQKAQKRESEIYHNLRNLFAEYADDFIAPKLSCDTFADILKYDSLVDSAVVVMRDGVKAVYLGEKRVAANGKTEVVFVGPTQDYVIPIATACDLPVLDVEMY